MNNAFNGQILAEKLSKLNNSQQSIETLSHWCIYHRKKAKQVVETWEKLFNSSQREQRVPFLYLANDILQNSRRRGSEFVNEFWKVLPAALRDVSENGDEYGKNVVNRLIGIWEERKVFGSHVQSLKDEMLSKDPPPLLESNGKSSQSHPIKVVRKDAHSIRIKLAVGGMPEKIVTAFQSVHDEHINEDTALNRCKTAVRRVGKMEKDVDDACTQGIEQGLALANELQEQETILRQCIDQIGSAEATREALVAKLKEALQEQETKLELIRTQMQVAQAQIEQASNMRQRLTSPTGPTTTTRVSPAEVALEPVPPVAQTSNIPQPPLPQPMTSVIQKISSPQPLLPQSAMSVIQTVNCPQPPQPQPMAAVIQTTNSPQPPPPQPVTAAIQTINSPQPPPAQRVTSAIQTTNSPQLQPVTSFANTKSTVDEEHKKAAAAVAAKLAASTSSAQMLTSILSSLAAEEAASKNSGQNASSFVTTLPNLPPEKRPKLEKPLAVSDSSAFFTQVQQHHLATLPVAAAPSLTTSMKSISQTNQPQTLFPPPPPLPPLPLPGQQYVQTSGVMTGAGPYAFGASNLPPPPPPPAHMPMGLARPATQPQLQPITTGFYQSQGIGFYGQSHQQTTPPVPPRP